MEVGAVVRYAKRLWIASCFCIMEAGFVIFTRWRCFTDSTITFGGNAMVLCVFREHNEAANLNSELETRAVFYANCWKVILEPE